MPQLPRRPRNPYTATMGKTPPVVAGRDSYVQDFAEALYDGPGTCPLFGGHLISSPVGLGRKVIYHHVQVLRTVQT